MLLCYVAKTKDSSTETEKEQKKSNIGLQRA